jgi:protein SCO1/2
MLRRPLVIALTAGVGLAALGAGFVARAVLDDRAAVTGTKLGAPFELVDHTGAPITEAAFEGRPSLLFFGFAHCPEICPTTVWEMDGWLETLNVGPDEVGAYFVTVDPERDTPEFLRDYLEPQSDRIVGISGEPEAVWDMARSWRVYWQKRPLGEDDYTVDHYASVFLLDETGAVVDIIPWGTDPVEAVAKIDRVL